tara:strand:- start:245 stop:1225 length:981 start_codon:yes stop_codon:yes gene_type:complete
MSDGNSMNEIPMFLNYYELSEFVEKTKPIAKRYSKSGASPNAGKIPLGERRYANLYWCRKAEGDGIELFYYNAKQPALHWGKDNVVTLTPEYYDWKTAEFYTRVTGARFQTHHGKIYMNDRNGKFYLLPSDQPFRISKYTKNQYGIYDEELWRPLKPMQEYKHVMLRNDMAEIRARFKPFYKYMQAVLAVDPEFGKSYETDVGLSFAKEDFKDSTEYDPMTDMTVLENFLREPTDDPKVMKEILVRTVTHKFQERLNRAWETGALGFHRWSYKDTRVGFKQAKDQFELILKVFYFNEVFEYVPVEIGKRVHDVNAKFARSIWDVKK